MTCGRGGLLRDALTPIPRMKNGFAAKLIDMERYEKVYLDMLIRIDTLGRITPVGFTWENGKNYDIDRVLVRRMSPPEHVGGALTEQFVCRVCGAERAFYRETLSGKWFVERRIE